MVPMLSGPEGHVRQLVLLKNCVFHLTVWPLPCLVLSRKGTFLGILIKLLTTFCYRRFLGTRFRSSEG